MHNRNVPSSLESKTYMGFRGYFQFKEQKQSTTFNHQKVIHSRELAFCSF